MPEIKRIFNGGKMNRDLDDRIIPPGEYREAFNVNIGQSEGGDVGSIENLLGNELVSQNPVTGGKCIGHITDNKTEKIYYFVTSNSIYNETNTGNHALVEYDQKNKQTTTLIISTQLNLHQSYPITGINIVDDLLFWTDDRNYPRKINVVTARNNTSYYTSSSDIDNLISVCKFAPYESPTLVSATKEASITSAFLQTKLIRFSYRWQFEDSEYSTLAPFTPICFSRLNETDTISLALGNFGEIETFVNAINQVKLQVPTPVGYGITNVELVYKEAGAGALYVVDEQEVTSENFVNFTYSSTDPFRTLPPNQLTRTYDAVPLKAKAQDVAGGRLVYGNFLQNFNLPQIAFSVARTGEASARNGILEKQSVKSRRTYQVGIVLADKFGRQSPVILSSSGVDTVYIDPNTGSSSSTTAFNALRLTFTDLTQIPSWAYSYRVVVKQREIEYYNWISTISALNNVERLGDSINKIPRDQFAVLPPSTSPTISPCNVSVYPKYLNGGNVYTTPQSNLTKVQSIANPSGTALVTTLDNSGAAVSSGLCVFETEPVSTDIDIFYETPTGGLISAIPATAIDINFFNCVLLSFESSGIFGVHLEINRIKAGYNEPFFDVGVRAYVVQENFTEERRSNTLIHSSGLLNSRTGINYINQFNESEGGLTISLDPQDGSVQKLFTDDTSITIFQEDKISKSPINKDFIYSSEGGAMPVTSNNQFLGTIAPIPGQYGIAKDPGSFATYGFSQYFTDRNRGVVLRLSQGQLQEISQVGLGDFFRDALQASTQVTGSFDEYSRLYELTLTGEGFDGNADTNLATAAQGYLTVCYDDRSGGWTAFRGFKQENGFSLNNSYYTFSGGSVWQHHSPNVTRNNFYNTGTQESYVIPIFNDAPSVIKQFNTLAYEGDSGWDIEYFESDIDTIGPIPVVATTFATSLQLAGAAANSTFQGPNTITAQTGETVTWVIFVQPASSQFKFTSPIPAPPEITLLQASGSVLTVTQPTAVTDGRLVFLVTHTVGSANSIQTLDITGTGAVLAFTVALLTVNTIDSIAFAAITPASQIFNTAGGNTVIIQTATVTGYYVENANIAINITGMPASSNPGTITFVRSADGNDLIYSLPVTVTNIAASGAITVSGAATQSPLLTWATIASPGVLTVPSGQTVGVAYPVSPYSISSLRLATILYTCNQNTEILLLNSYIATYNLAGTVVTPVLNSTAGQLTLNVQLGTVTSDITATGTITGVGPQVAALGAVPATQSLVAAGTSVSIPGTWNVQILANPNFGWVTVNGTAGGGLSVVESLTAFLLGAEINTTGVARTATLTIVCNNSRIQGGSSPLSNKVITITQAA